MPKSSTNQWRARFKIQYNKGAHNTTIIKSLTNHKGESAGKIPVETDSADDCGVSVTRKHLELSQKVSNRPDSVKFKWNVFEPLAETETTPGSNLNNDFKTATTFHIR